MAATRTVPIGTLTVTAKELTVTEVRDWVAEHESGATVDPIGQMVFDDCSLDDLARMSDMTVDAMGAFSPSELAALRDACRGLNPHFFKVREALIGVSRMIQAGLDSLSSTVPSQP